MEEVFGKLGSFVENLSSVTEKLSSVTKRLGSVTERLATVTERADKNSVVFKETIHNVFNRHVTETQRLELSLKKIVGIKFENIFFLNN